jgi:hypothetical protein
MKKEQLQLFAKLGRTITPKPERKNPVLWIRELRILRKLETGDSNEVRRVTLRRGLNIIWAPPEEGDEPELYGDGLSGHASGKTLFCRILRYLLGESSYGPDSLQEAVEESFQHELWALAEVFLGGQLWLSARPLAGTAHKFAMRGSTIDEFLQGQPTRGDFTDFTKAVEGTVCGEVLAAAQGGEQFGWRYLLPWLARDQECRFSGLTEWRSALAKSENPQTSAGEQQELMQAVLDLLKAEEVTLRSTLSSAEDAIKQANEELPELERVEKRDYGKLADALRRAGVELSQIEEGLPELKERRRLRAEGLSLAVQEAERDQNFVTAQSAWEAAVTARNNLDGRLTQAQQTLGETTQKLATRASRYQQMRAAGIENPARMEQGFCPKTLDFAKSRGCVPAPPGASLETEMNLGEILTEGDELEQLKKEQETQVRQLTTQQTKLAGDVATTFRAYTAEKQRIQNSTAQIRLWQQQLGGTVNLFEAADESAASAEQSRVSLATNTETKAQTKGKIEVLRKLHAGPEQRLSGAFADAVRAAMGDKVEPVVNVTERGIVLSVKRKGELSGAALETIKVLAFDIAALVLSLEGVGFHPRFLIHDGPREADMARVIYERFFLYARKLEQCFSDPNQINFQYILTTTTHPPKDMRDGTDWLRLTLNTTVTSERLLRADF